jgi:hypothetical protein
VNFPLGVVLAAGALLLGYEGFAYFTRRAPVITDLVRAGERKHPILSRFIVFGLGVLAGHLWR